MRIFQFQAYLERILRNTLYRHFYDPLDFNLVQFLVESST